MVKSIDVPGPHHMYLIQSLVRQEVRPWAVAEIMTNIIYPRIQFRVNFPIFNLRYRYVTYDATKPLARLQLLPILQQMKLQASFVYVYM